jgi:hypothetical protein
MLTFHLEHNDGLSDLWLDWASVRKAEARENSAASPIENSETILHNGIARQHFYGLISYSNAVCFCYGTIPLSESRLRTRQSSLAVS